MEIWAELSYEDEITSVDSFLSQSLWNNSLIRIMGKPVFYKNWYQMGISTVSDIIKEKPNSFLSPTELEIKYHIKVCTLTFYGITSVLKTLDETKIEYNNQRLCTRNIYNWPDEIKETKQIGVPKIIGNKM